MLRRRVVLRRSSTTATTTKKVLRGGGGKALSKKEQQKEEFGRKFIVFASSTKKKRIFIDGEAGTTGLQVRDRLEKRASGDIELIQLPDSLRKDAKAREEALNEADCAILCLPDAAAVEGGGLGDQSKHGDHRREHRVQNERRVDVRVSGIIERATGESENGEENFQSRMLPDWIYRFDEAFVENGFIPKGLRTTVNAVSGYTGGGKQLIAIYESPEAEPYGAYGFNLNHKHIPEMRKYAD